MRETVITNNNKIRWGLSALFSLLILFGTFHSAFSLLAFALCCLVIFFCDREFILCQMFFIMPMANIFKMAPGSQSFFTIILLIYVLFHLVLPRNATAIIILFGVYIMIVQLAMGEINLFKTIKLVCNVLFLSSVLNNQVKTRHREIFLSYIVGNVAASIIGLMDSPVFKVESFIGVEEFASAELEVFVTRFTGLYPDPNYYSVGLIISLCLLVILYHRNEIKVFPALLLSGTIIYFLITTYSKSAIAMLVVVLLFLIYALAKKRKFVPIIILSFFAVTIIVLAFSGQIPALEVIVKRFMASDTLDGMDVNELTTGRTDIWLMYARYLISNSRILLFGQGVGAGYYNKAPHSTYLDFLYFLGIAGTALLLLSLLAISKQSRLVKTKRNILNYSVMFCVVVMYCFLSELFFFDIPFHLFVAFTAMNLSEDRKRCENAS